MKNPYLYSQYWTGANLQLRLNANDNNFFLMILPRTSLHRKLVEFQSREYKYGLIYIAFLVHLKTKSRRTADTLGFKPFTRI